MAALCPGLQYGLSSQESFSENKDLIFVKLTDSALRAIEEYLKNKNKFSCQSPTIKFLGNEGQLAFPSGGSTASFSFSMSSTHDMEGPGGSFECLRQTGPPRGPLEMLGSIPYKIRVHANDDVYAATRQRMTVAEENQKNKCTREIKPNQNDIGRKVKVKQTPAPNVRPSPQVHSSSRGGDKPTPSSHTSMRDSLLKSSYQSPNNSTTNGNGSNRLSSSSSSGSVVNSTTQHQYHSNNGHHQQMLSNGLGSNHVSSSRPQNKPTTPDILKRPLKERLIHLLALRPHKKFEIFERLTKEGVREKGSMSSVLKQIAQLKDNAFHLNRACWNDVRENWPFYTESEKQILKRRKPQNLTPPGSSDGGSSGSGQSPTSTHPGSPPPPVTTTTAPSTNKRPGYYDGADGFPTKRQRVSHYRKPVNGNNISTTSGGNNVTSLTAAPITTTTSSSSHVADSNNALPLENNKSQRRPITDSRDSSNMNPRSRESPTTTTAILAPNNNNNNVGNVNGFAGNHYVNGYENNGNNHHVNSSNSNNGGSSFKRGRLSDGEDATADYDEDVSSKNNNNNGKRQRPPSSAYDYGYYDATGKQCRDGAGAGGNDAYAKSNGHRDVVVDYNNGGKFVGGGGNVVDSSAKEATPAYSSSDRWSSGSANINNNMNCSNGGNNNNNVAEAKKYESNNNGSVGRYEREVTSSASMRVSPDSQTEPVSPEKSGKKNNNNGIVATSIYPDYLSEYTPITNYEQRKRYKSDFNDNYAEYKDLHGIVEKVSRRFAELEERLKQEDTSSPRYKDIKKQIMKEYKENKKNIEHQKAKQRFQYLHDKLSHIKQLVRVYDKSILSRQYQDDRY